MKLEEYLNKIAELKLKHQKEIRKIIGDYALSSNPVKIGDIVTDHYHTVKVEKFGIYNSEDKPSCIYYGLLYTKAGKPSKKGTQESVYEMNLKFINKVPFNKGE